VKGSFSSGENFTSSSESNLLATISPLLFLTATVCVDAVCEGGNPVNVNALSEVPVTVP
jgi:hypothetical protein